MKIGIIYGSSTGATEIVADHIKDHFGELASSPIEVYKFDPKGMEQYDVLLLGIPTWHIGEMQEDWEDAAEKFAIPQMKGKKVGLFGCGDQGGYPDTFGDALGLLWDIIEPAGPELIGRWSTDGYDYEASVGERDGTFLGLMVDEDHQPSLSNERIEKWCTQVKQELGLG
ncbi:MAG: flavodoxin [Phycisphaerales bacterium]|nr:flavodoxin [Phycisphaerales bacterium]